jgi:hypothetical protein
MNSTTSVAGTAPAMPLSTNTAISLRKGRQAQGEWARLAAASAGWWAGCSARVQASQPMAMAAASTHSVVVQPTTAGKADATSTPTRPAPSRQANSRLRAPSVRGKAAPQVWCAMLNRLLAVPASTSASVTTAPCARGEPASGPNSANRASTTASAATADTPSRWRGERASSRSVQRPSAGSMSASNTRTASSTPPAMVSDQPNVRARCGGRCTYKGKATKASGRPINP